MSRSGVLYRYGLNDLRDFVKRLIDGEEPEGLIASKWPRVRERDNVIRHKPQRDDLAIAFHKPIRRAYRLSTPDGRTSFHFSHSVVVQKGKSLMIGNVEIQPGAASEHCRYIEREGAVAAVSDPGRASGHSTSEAMKAGIVSHTYQENENDLRPYAGHYLTLDSGAPTEKCDDLRSTIFRAEPDGATPDGLFALPGSDVGAFGWRADCILRDYATRRVDEKASDPAGGVRGAISGLGTLDGRADPKGRGRGARSIAADHRSYLERPDALARQPDGALAIVTNIADDPATRQRFWQAVEENESKPSPDCMSLNLSHAPDFWALVGANERCPAELRDAILSDDDADRIRFAIPSGKEMRAFLETVPGWIGKRKKQPGESSKNYARDVQPLAKFHDGRGGRVQQRIILELPSESSMAARMRMLTRFCYEFERRGLPFNGVIHAPDHGSDERQWHAHIDYYHRPVRLITEADVLAMKASGLVPDGDVVGQWDFEARFFEGSRRDRVRRPFRQNTVSEVRADEWIPHLRSRLAFVVNAELRAEGHCPRYDPRSYNEMGIKADPAEHLGVKLNAAEGKGEVSETGLANERKQWVAIEQAENDRLEAAKAAIDAAANIRRQRLAMLDLDPGQAAYIASGIASIADWSSRGANASHERAMSHELAARACSRATYIHDKSDRILRAADAGKTELSAKQRNERQALLSASAEFLERLRPFREAVRETVQRCDAASAEAAKVVRATEQVVDTLLADAETQARKATAVSDTVSVKRADGSTGEAERSFNAAATQDSEQEKWFEQLRGRRPLVQRTSIGFRLSKGESHGEIGRSDVQTILHDLFLAQEREVDELLGDPGFRLALNRRSDGWHLYGQKAEIARRFIILREHPRVSREISRIVAPSVLPRRAIGNLAPQDAKRIRSTNSPSGTVARDDVGVPAATKSGEALHSGEPVQVRQHEQVPVASTAEGETGAGSGPPRQSGLKLAMTVQKLIDEGVPLTIGADGKIDTAALSKQGILMEEEDRSNARLIGRARKQTDYARRAVTSFVKKAPSFIIEREGRYLLSPQVKADIAQLARDYDSPAMQLVLKLALQEHRFKTDQQLVDEPAVRSARFTDVVKNVDEIARAEAFHSERRRREDLAKATRTSQEASAGDIAPPPSPSPHRQDRPPPGWDRGGPQR